MVYKKILVTGGAGFIGSEFVRQAAKRGYAVAVADKITYAGDLKRLISSRGKHRFYKADVCDKKALGAVMTKERPEVIVNFAAETHVDRSILDAQAFLDTNIGGAKVLLDLALKYKIKRFVQISTDEVYGEIVKGKFREDSPLAPNSPYAASKASADMLVRSYARTYGLPALIVRPCNNYGPWQYPEKFIPVVIHKALGNERVPVYAKGLNVREWLHVSDCAAGILKVMEKGKPGEVYNIGSGQEKRNIDVAKEILAILAKPAGLIKHVKDRPGHDLRYSLDSSKIEKALGFSPRVRFKDGLGDTVNWYIANSDWLLEKAKFLAGYWRKVYKG